MDERRMRDKDEIMRGKQARSKACESSSQNLIPVSE